MAEAPSRMKRTGSTSRRVPFHLWNGHVPVLEGIMYALSFGGVSSVQGIAQLVTEVGQDLKEHGGQKYSNHRPGTVEVSSGAWISSKL